MAVYRTTLSPTIYADVHAKDKYEAEYIAEEEIKKALEHKGMIVKFDN